MKVVQNDALWCGCVGLCGYYYFFSVSLIGALGYVGSQVFQPNSPSDNPGQTDTWGHKQGAQQDETCMEKRWWIDVAGTKTWSFWGGGVVMCFIYFATPPNFHDYFVYFLCAEVCIICTYGYGYNNITLHNSFTLHTYLKARPGFLFKVKLHLESTLE